ncbi:hypothetical protein BH10CYA1_BH10CYA1_48730 [soil metagenome]
MFDETFKDKPELKVGNPEIVETPTPEGDPALRYCSVKARPNNSGPDLTLDRLKFDGEVAFTQKRYPQAIAKFKEALSYVEKNKLDDAPSLLLLHDKLARAYQGQNDLVDEARELRSAIPLAKDPSQLACVA